MPTPGWIAENATAWLVEWTRRNGGEPVCSRATAFRVADETDLQSEHVPELGGFFVRQESVWDVWSMHVRHRALAWTAGREKQRGYIGRHTDPTPSTPQREAFPTATVGTVTPTISSLPAAPPGIVVDLPTPEGAAWPHEPEPEPPAPPPMPEYDG